MQISNNSNSILSSDLYDISTDVKQNKDRFDIFMENRDKEKTENKKRESILEDIESISKTGFTKDEIELIKKKLEEIQNKRAESGYTAQSIEEDLANKKADLQQAIYEATGKTVNLENNDLNNLMTSQENQNSSLNKASTDEELRLVDKFKKETV
ncbi:hypothetical protein CRU87_00240 [Aliarcobacter trophiarum LMG 25534]|uniref:Uncharacterized protein n=1 Tax=Aliarcobacter trophiarum LMG 25534 TaxID=1032241 RepID=A0AAD0VLN0_9BACT|nr:hypothetical protein [Aliarcobacter trophiarum]AXK48377.1 hypothetical protein ATR_0496 [Aliarcobacter trophiarum LMG 25534]RXI28650.1 hypothetical protein CRU89_01465 [Aliarcobacter trophiarum]RXJ92953.1 hypothetical protein CRU87_00240 [Aliarcobacter trophiarum LMG 25534]